MPLAVTLTVSPTLALVGEAVRVIELHTGPRPWDWELTCAPPDSERLQPVASRAASSPRALQPGVAVFQRMGPLQGIEGECLQVMSAPNRQTDSSKLPGNNALTQIASIRDVPNQAPR